MIILGADHAGWHLKEELKNILREKKILFMDCSNSKLDPQDDYPDIAFRVGEKVVQEKGKGILICGSGSGISIAVNKVLGIRAISLDNLAKVQMACLHNNINVLCLSGFVFNPTKKDDSFPSTPTDPQEAFQLIEVFLHTPFEGGRHQRRIKKIDLYEQKKES